ncbi:MAG: cytochrome c3 family protein [Bacteroidota bacterium]
MRGLSLIVVFILSFFLPSSDSPHEKDLDISCSECHTSDGWKIDRNDIIFNHNNDTKFMLQGLHQDVNCVACHSTLIFSDAQTECVSCHTDMHQQTVGIECARCHNTNSWIVNNITEIHQQSRFPLLGAHITADCFDCHQSASLLIFEPLGVECVDCHLDNYQSTTSPNHVESDYSTDCAECHKMNAFTWIGSDYTHAFFPLVEGHAINDCRECHTDPGNYSNISTECFSCHEADYNAATVPNHIQSDLSTNCTECHTLSLDWRPAEFAQHDVLFPIYSGEHNGEWNSCVDCHNNPSNISIFTCIDCHEHNKTDMDDEHKGIGGYSYNSIACFECHPTGSEDGFDHNISNFPLTGAHIDTECDDCHVAGYTGTPTICSECHTPDFNETTNPNHVEIGINNECETCHSTDPGWQPALFEVHDDYYVLTGAHLTTFCADCHTDGYPGTPNNCVDCHIDEFNQTTNPDHVDANLPNDCAECHTTNPGWTPATFDHSDYPLNGAHALIANDCNACHNGNYTTTPNTCFGCHETDYNQTNDPPHEVAQFSTECLICHTETVWIPSTFDHDNQYFPIYSGDHVGEWNACIDCHTIPNNYSLFSCIDCHEHNKTDMDEEHKDENDYVYNSDACFECHPDGSEKFNGMFKNFNKPTER